MEKLMKSFKKNGPEFIVLNEYDFNWDFVGQATDPLTDWIDMNYEHLQVTRPVWILHKRIKPWDYASLVKGNRGR